MLNSVTVTRSGQLGALLRGDLDFLRAWIIQSEARPIAQAVAVIVIGSGCYGAAMGAWRAPLQALFVAIKFPLIVLLTTAGNALLNAMLAPLLGLRITFRQSVLAVLLSFTIAAAILGAFSPLAFFLVWNAPALNAASQETNLAYGLILLFHVGSIALAGVVSNLRLAQLLNQWSGRGAVAQRVLFAWLAGNLFLGSQLSWCLRPFIGSPDLPIQFVRPNAFEGNFYETVFHTAIRVLNANH